MSKLLLIMGDLAAGKSTFAKKLGERYNTNVFYKDKLKELLGDTIGFQNREENLKLSKASVELMNMFICEFGSKNTNLILESNFHDAEIIKIHELADQYNFDVLTLLLEADIDVIHKRHVNRMENENRHPVHLSEPFKEFEDFKNYIEKSREVTEIGKIIKINANDFSYQNEEKLLKQIDDFMNN